MALGTWTSSRVMFNVPTDCILTGFEEQPAERILGISLGLFGVD